MNQVVDRRYVVCIAEYSAQMRRADIVFLCQRFQGDLFIMVIGDIGQDFTGQIMLLMIQRYRFLADLFFCQLNQSKGQCLKCLVNNTTIYLMGMEKYLEGIFYVA